MANASLNIPITGDASALIAEVNRAAAELKKIQEQFNNAFTTKGKKLKVEIDETLIEGSIADLKQKIRSLEETRGKLAPFDIANIEAANRQIEEYKNEIKRLQGIGIRIDVELPPPPPGSINDIKRQIAELGERRGIAVGVDLTNANIKLQELKSLLKSLETQGVVIDVEPISPVVQNSIGSLEKELLELRAAAKNIDLGDETEIARLNDKIKELEATIERYKGLSIDPNGKLTQSSAKARQAITSLSLVAQDLPFGFIAIQNNLPAVLQTFTELEKKNKGVKGAFKELAGALVGPAGFFLAFSAVTGAVTYAVQEYGSLSAALSVLSGTSEAVVKSQKEFNEELTKSSGSSASEISKINTLVQLYQNENSTQKERLAAYRALKEINPSIVAGIDEQNYATAQSIKLVGQNAQAVIRLIRIQTTQKAIGKALDELEQQRLIANGKYIAAREEAFELEKKIAAVDAKIAAKKPLTSQERTIDKQRKLITEGYTNALNDAREGISEITKEQQKWENSLANITVEGANTNSELDTYIKNLDELRDRQKDASKNKIDFKFDLKLSDDFRELTDYNTLDKSLDRLRQYADIVLDVNKTEKERSDALKKLSEDSKNVYGINQDLFEGFKIGKTPIKEITNAIDDYGLRIQDLIVKEKEYQINLKKTQKLLPIFGQIYKDTARQITGANISGIADAFIDPYEFEKIKDLAKDLPKGVIEAFKEFNGDFPSLEQFKKKVTEILSLEFLKTGKLTDLQISEIINKELSNLKATVEFTIDTTFDFKDVEKATKLIEDRTKQIEEVRDKIKSTLSGVQSILEDTFIDFFEDGKVSWKEFADVAIKEIKRIIAALISKALIQGIANLLAPGSGSVISAGFKGIDTSTLGTYDQALDWIDLFPTGGKKGGAANFGNIRGQRSMAMSGQVNMVLRGSDLVGAMNRTNSTINRVG